VRVLVVDDSAVYRSQIKAALSRIPFVEIVGSASNGKIALEQLKTHTVDLITLDLEMPEMNGIEFLKALKESSLSKPKIIVFSSLSRAGADITLEALRLGATDFATKPGSGEGGGDPAEKIYQLLEPKLSAFFGSHVLPTLTPATHWPKIILAHFRPKVLVIGSSTGGPNALETIFSHLKAPVICPILIAQHMPPIFTQSLAARLEQLSQIPAREAQAGEPLLPNRIYVAPGNYHFKIGGSAKDPRVELNQNEQIHSVRPAVDPLFESAAQIYGPRCLGMVLTGMGQDGKRGAVAIKEKGGAMIIQNRASSVVYGMPGSVEAAGAFDYCGNLQEIEAQLASMIR
jgi:two-component system chemotaxis response regulator CheB